MRVTASLRSKYAFSVVAIFFSTVLVASPPLRNHGGGSAGGGFRAYATEPSTMLVRERDDDEASNLTDIAPGTDTVYGQPVPFGARYFSYSSRNGYSFFDAGKRRLETPASRKKAPAREPEKKKSAAPKKSPSKEKVAKRKDASSRGRGTAERQRIETIPVKSVDDARDKIAELTTNIAIVKFGGKAWCGVCGHLDSTLDVLLGMTPLTRLGGTTLPVIEFGSEDGAAGQKQIREYFDGKIRMPAGAPTSYLIKKNADGEWVPVLGDDDKPMEFIGSQARNILAAIETETTKKEKEDE